MRHEFAREATNGVWIIGEQDVGRRTAATTSAAASRSTTATTTRAKKVNGIEHMSGQYFIRGGQFGGARDDDQARRQGERVPDQRRPPRRVLPRRRTRSIAGRFLTDGRHRAAAQVGRRSARPVADFLFEPDEDPIGEWIEIGGVPFQVVGVFTRQGGAEQERQIYIPVSTAQLAFNGGDKLGMLEFTVGNAERRGGQGDHRHRSSRSSPSAHQFSPDDTQAVRVHNNVEQLRAVPEDVLR